VGALFGHLAAIDDEDLVVGPEGLLDQALMRAQDRGVVPRAFADELLEGPHRPGCLGPDAQQPQRHGLPGTRLRVLAGHIREEQPAQIPALRAGTHLRPLPLLTPLEERCDMRMVRAQFVGQIGQIVRCERQYYGSLARHIVGVQFPPHGPTPDSRGRHRRYVDAYSTKHA